MTNLFRTLTAVAAGAVLTTTASGQDTRVAAGAAPFVFPVENEPAAKLIVEPPLPDALARGAVLIPYRVENVRLLPALGADAAKLSPRVGHLHITVDNLPWHWGDFSGANTIVVVAMPPGPHKVLIEVADPQHHILTGQTVAFTVPAATK